MRPRLQLLGAALLFSTGGAAIKLTALGGWQIACLRSGIAAAALLLVLPAARRGWSVRIAPVALAFAATMILFVLANRLTTAGNAIFLQSTAPLYILVLGPLLLRERIRPRDALFMGAVGAGLALVLTAGTEPQATAPDPARGNLLGATAGLTWALTVVGLRWLGREEGSGTGTVVRTVVAGNLLAFVATLPWALPLGGAGWADALVVGYLGVFQIGAAYLLLSRGIGRVSALDASLLLLLEPALNPLWAWLVLGEVPAPAAIGGGALILGATVVKLLLSLRPGGGTPGLPIPAGEAGATGAGPSAGSGRPGGRSGPPP